MQKCRSFLLHFNSTRTLIGHLLCKVLICSFQLTVGTDKGRVRQISENTGSVVLECAESETDGNAFGKPSIQITVGPSHRDPSSLTFSK